MIAGLPGTGIGGLFYIVSALWMPAHRLLRGYSAGREWRRVGTQAAMASAILISLGATGWFLGFLLMPGLVSAPGSTGAIARHTESVVRWVTLIGTAGLLLGVLAVVEVLRLIVRARPRIGSTALLVLFALLPADVTAQGPEELASLLARADSAYNRADTAAASAAYQSLLRLDPSHTRALYRLAHLQPRGSDAALRLLRRYTELEPRDAWGHLALGQSAEAAGDRPAARAAYHAALQLQPADEEMRQALGRLSGKSGEVLAVRPVMRVSGDSDGNRTVRTGLEGAASINHDVSLGLAVTRVQVTDDIARESGWEGVLSGDWNPQRALRIETRAGAVRLETAGGDVVKGMAHARLRWRPERGVNMDLRARHEPIAATPQLFSTPVVLSEARATIEAPVISGIRLRGYGRLGRLRDPFAVNHRTGWGAGPVLRLAPASELSAAYARTHYANPSEAGYFAPASIEAIDAGVYHEHYGWWPLMIALDVGGGVERATQHDAVPASWRRALRLWSQISWAIAANSELALEIDAYETQIGDAIAASAGQWRWGSIALTAMWRP